MSRIKNLKERSDLNIIEILSQMLPNQKSKYIETLYRIIKNKCTYYQKEMTYVLKDTFNIPVESLKTMDPIKIVATYMFIDRICYSNEIEDFKKFIQLSESGQILQTDLTKYNTIEDIVNQINVSELRLLDKEMSKQVIKIFEDDQWLMVKPLTYLSSAKYGSNTKWCTTTKDDASYFFKYAGNGVLIYVINKLTGIKFAVHKEIKYGNELSFWDEKDSRVDSMTLNIPDLIQKRIREEVFNSDVKSNLDYRSEEDKEQEIKSLEINKKYSSQEDSIPVPREIVPQNEGYLISEQILSQLTQDNPTNESQYRIYDTLFNQNEA